MQTKSYAPFEKEVELDPFDKTCQISALKLKHSEIESKADKNLKKRKGSCQLI